MMRVQRNTNGFTLVEMLVYIAILMMVVVSSITMLFSLEDLFVQYRAEQKITRSATTALERVLSDIRNADSVTGSSYQGEGFLTLSVDGSSHTYATSGPALHLSQNGTDLGPLTEEGVEVVSFRAYTYSDVTDLVRVEMQLRASFRDVSVTETFNVGAVVRGSYE